MGGGCVEGQELSGATAPGRVGADGHDRSFVEEGGQGAAEVRAGGVQCLAELRTRRRGEGEVGDDTVLEGGEGGGAWGSACPSFPGVCRERCPATASLFL